MIEYGKNLSVFLAKFFISKKSYWNTSSCDSKNYCSVKNVCFAFPTEFWCIVFCDRAVQLPINTASKSKIMRGFLACSKIVILYLKVQFSFRASNWIFPQTLEKYRNIKNESIFLTLQLAVVWVFYLRELWSKSFVPFAYHLDALIALTSTGLRKNLWTR